MRVLIATDGSEHAEQAASFFARLPHRDRLEVVLMTVRRPLVPHGSLEVTKWMESYLVQEQKRAQDSMDRIAAMLDGANAGILQVVTEGHPAKCIVEESQRQKSDLIVIGGVGLTGLDRWLLGSTSDYVASHAKCSVCLVRKPSTQAVQHRFRVCLPVDSSEPCRRALQSLREFGWKGGTEFHVVHVMMLPLMMADIPIPIDIDELTQVSQKVVSDAVHLIEEVVPVQHQQVIEGGHIGYAVAEYAQSRDCDMIYVGDTDRGLVDRFLLGSVTRYLLRHTKISMWIAR